MKVKNNEKGNSFCDSEAWMNALQRYLDKEEKGKDYRSFLIEALLKDRILVEQADWILERIGELPLQAYSSGEEDTKIKN